MFTGLIEEVGTVAAVRTTAGSTQLQIAAPHMAKGSKTGDSIAVNGCCLTLKSGRAGNLTFDLLEETIGRTNLKHLRPRNRVNLERALSAKGRLGGHFVQGHVDCASAITAFDRKGADWRLEIELPAEFRHYIAGKGSVAVNGISLTVAEILTNRFVVWIIPYTKRHTNLDSAQAGDLANIEFDILAKYVERMLQQTTRSGRVNKTSGGIRTNGKP
jgi:riboflavin synthase